MYDYKDSKLLHMDCRLWFRVDMNSRLNAQQVLLLSIIAFQSLTFRKGDSSSMLRNSGK